MTNQEQRVECARCGAMYLCLPDRSGGPIRWLREHFATDHGGVPLPRLLRTEDTEPEPAPEPAPARDIEALRCACGRRAVARGHLSEHREGCTRAAAAPR